ncbi:hypothetical protein AB1Y20_015446 [Prymnesium parvum]|uniref:Uncharacterized protein n=1 Tax=Prymnesium parvum TaxID=97485 RepID=A0AB34K1F9_PRYPA
MPSFRFPGRAATPRRANMRSPKLTKMMKLLISVLIDLIGMATYVVPVLGEAGDFAWAPISSLVVYQLYGNAVISGLALAEELLPGTDIIPTATIAWLLENTRLSQLLNVFSRRR